MSHSTSSRLCNISLSSSSSPYPSLSSRPVLYLSHSSLASMFFIHLGISPDTHLHLFTFSLLSSRSSFTSSALASLFVSSSSFSVFSTCSLFVAHWFLCSCCLILPFFIHTVRCFCVLIRTHAAQVSLLMLGSLKILTTSHREPAALCLPSTDSHREPSHQHTTTNELRESHADLRPDPREPHQELSDLALRQFTHKADVHQGHGPRPRCIDKAWGLHGEPRLPSEWMGSTHCDCASRPGSCVMETHLAHVFPSLSFCFLCILHCGPAWLFCPFSLSFTCLVPMFRVRMSKEEDIGRRPSQSNRCKRDERVYKGVATGHREQWGPTSFPCQRARLPSCPQSPPPRCSSGRLFRRQSPRDGIDHLATHRGTCALPRDELWSKRRRPNPRRWRTPCHATQGHSCAVTTSRAS